MLDGLTQRACVTRLVDQPMEIGHTLDAPSVSAVPGLELQALA
jgi:hypothetical protein